MKAQIELLEKMFQGIDPRIVLTALHNACAHGGSLRNCDQYDVTDEQLGKLFDGFDMSLKALKAMR